MEDGFVVFDQVCTFATFKIVFFALDLSLWCCNWQCLYLVNYFISMGQLPHPCIRRWSVQIILFVALGEQLFSLLYMATFRLFKNLSIFLCLCSQLLLLLLLLLLRYCHTILTSFLGQSFHFFDLILVPIFVWLEQSRHHATTVLHQWSISRAGKLFQQIVVSSQRGHIVFLIRSQFLLLVVLRRHYVDQLWWHLLELFLVVLYFVFLDFVKCYGFWKDRIFKSRKLLNDFRLDLIGQS